MKDSQKQAISARIVELRVATCGRRGKSAFARQLGLSPSTYDYYESDRVPPADTLVAIADLAGVDLRWLITGQKTVGEALPAGHPLIRRAADLLADRPNAAPALAAFLDILSQSMEFPAKRPAEGQRSVELPVGAGLVPGDDASPSGPAGPDQSKDKDVEQDDRQGAWIPILGRSAAGVPHFWSGDQAEGVTQLGELIDRHAKAASRHVRPASSDRADSHGPEPVQIVTLDRPAGGGVAEFVVAETIKSQWPDAFAVRIDGESMAPEMAHGDLVVLSPSVPAADGAPAVVQLAGQIGVTCKLYRRSGRRVHLSAINEQFPPESFPAETVRWALRVLARVHPH